uniref:NADH dehydrogenase subunit 6 n=1 Tax=Panagrolaimus davidi TaxID=227884 RepID=A0A914PX01_9BILA
MYCRIIGIYCSRALLMSIYVTDFEIYFSYISDISYAIFATILCFIAALNIAIKKRSKNQKVEKVLLIQSFTSSIFLILSTATSWFASANKASNDVSTPPTDAEISEAIRSVSLQTFFNAFSKFFYDVHHYVGLLLLLIMS